MTTKVMTTEELFANLTYQQLDAIHDDLRSRKETGEGGMTLAPLARDIHKIYNKALTIGECMQVAETLFFWEVAKRYFSGNET